jgi:translocation and assembly module TamB
MAVNSWWSVKQLDIAARWSKDSLTIERLSLLPGDIAGTLSVTGRVAPQGKTLRGALDAAWQDVVIPEKLAGRVLASQGELHFDGTPEQYRVASHFDVGPPGDLTQVEVQLHGTQRHATLNQLVMQQRAGRLALQGLVDFKPELAWNLHANADDFNPGALLAGWDGRVDLDFRTRGQLAEAGPRGSLQLKTLAGPLARAADCRPRRPDFRRAGVAGRRPRGEFGQEPRVRARRECLAHRRHRRPRRGLAERLGTRYLG